MQKGLTGRAVESEGLMSRTEPGEKVAEIRVHPVRANLAAVPPAAITILFLLRLAAWLNPADDGGLWSFLAALLLFFPLVAVHEFLHGLTAVVVGGLRWQDIRFSMAWKALAPMCHIKAPLRVQAARIVGLAPLAGTVPPILVLLFVSPSEMTALLAGLVLVGCFADVYMVYRLREFDASMWVVDHPTEAGFDIYAGRPASLDGQTAS